MDVNRLRGGERIAAIGGVALFIFMFFTWFEAPGLDQVPDTGLGGAFKEQLSANAWESFDFLDIIMFLTVIASVGLAVMTMTQRSVNLPVAASAITAGLGILSTVLIVYRILNPIGDPNFDRKIGLFLGLIAAAAVAYGGWRSMQEEGTSFGQAADQLGDRFGGGSPPPPSQPPPPPPPSS
jgi:hypothetical protein